MHTERACSWLFCCATIAACAPSPKPETSEAPQQVSEPAEQMKRPSFTAVSTEPTVDPRLCTAADPASTDPDTFKAGFGMSPADLATEVIGAFQTTLRWTTIAPPGTGAADQEPATLDVEYLGTSRFFSACGAAELDLQVHLRSETGRLDVTVPAVFATSASRPDFARVTATLPLSALPDWRDAVEAMADQIPKGFQIQLFLVNGSLSGEFSVLAPDIGRCALARFPATTRCEPGEQSVPGDQLLLGLRARDVLDALPAVGAPKNFFWEDLRTTTQVSVDFRSTGEEACVMQVTPSSYGDPSYVYRLLGQARITTADHRVDITIPAGATTSSTAGDWTPIIIHTDTATPIDPKQAAAFDFDVGDRRALPTFSSSQPMFFSDGTLIDQGMLHIDAIALKSTSVNPTGGLCAVEGFLGLQTPITTGDYLADGQKPPLP